MKLDLSSLALALAATLTSACAHHEAPSAQESSHALAERPVPDEPPPADPPPPPPPPAAGEIALAAGVLAPCAPRGLDLHDPAPVPARVTGMLGGCGLPVERAPMPPLRSAPARPPELAALPDAARIQEVTRCPPGRQPQVDLQTTTYAFLEDVHRSSDDWEVVFAVDDGQRVHVGMRLRRTCQGVVPTFYPTRTVLEVSSPNRALVVHRCETVIPRCGPVP